MPFWDVVDHDALLGKDWEKHAERLWGIPLHPLGEMSTFEYMMAAQGDLQEMRARSLGAYMQHVINAMGNYIFFRNVIVSLKMLYRRPYTLATWCCLIQSLAGVAYTLYALALPMPGGPSCRSVLWNIGIGLAISPICVSITLLQKAYIVHNRSRWLLITGIILMLPQPLVTYYAWTSPAVMVPVTACLSLYPAYFPWIKLATDAPINMVFSAAFLTVVYRQYCLFGSGAWRRLMRNGIQTMCLVVISNFICMLAAALSLLGPLSEMFIVLDWILTSLLLVYHSTHLRSDTSNSHDPHTPNVMIGFSQIKAAESMHMPEHTITADQAKYSTGPRYVSYDGDDAPLPH
ncbi:hypothetical protein THASP1DRAFT_23911 [Thamnocephalis sphaerospora]|uniref:Uncharacterized protein n=1 Tax=Thamnocephalis sphaerospora TaxID=78915 RepID=A0A4P9XPT3_9FUNG|nr:hypothetical protein THASP1DRAFT_23911 [Thamnocephalis sphaerospora]|eukprot:RKP08024.1 hypothetical protein THASP1DRAFT_23911 [Thamnocephalis sphaerospora]